MPVLVELTAVHSINLAAATTTGQIHRDGISEYSGTRCFYVERLPNARKTRSTASRV